MPASKKDTSSLTIPQPLLIKMESDESSETHLPGWAVAISATMIFVLMISIALWALFISSKATPSTSDALSVTALLDIPKYASLRDTLPVTVTLHNNSDKTLDFDLTLIAEPQNDIVLGKDGMDVIHVKELPPGGTFTHTFTYLPVNKPDKGPFNFKVIMDNQQADAQQTNGQPTNKFHEELASNEWISNVISKVTHLRSIANYLLTGGLLSTILTLFSDRLKKALGFS